MTSWRSVQDAVAHECTTRFIRDQQCRHCAPMFGNGFLAGLALAVSEPEYALALWRIAGSEAVSAAFFNEHHGKRSHEITERWPLEAS